MKRLINIVSALVTLSLAHGAARAENIVYPPGAQVVNVKLAPYNAHGDGVADDTGALQAAIDDHAGDSRIIYLPNGAYRVSKTLQWPVKNRAGNNIYGFTHLQGQSRSGVVLRLQDGVFPDAKSPHAVMNAGAHGSADWFACDVRNLSIEVGKNNAGAVGMQFFSNNRGSVRDLTIRALGPSVCGLDLSYNDMNGPLLVKNVLVQGFATGVACGNSVNSQTFEHLRLENQTHIAFSNDGQCVSVRDLRVSGPAIPAVENKYGVMTLIDAVLQNSENAKFAAIVNGEILFARGIVAKGYKLAIQNNTKKGTPNARGPWVSEWVSHPVVHSNAATPSRSLNLHAIETPDVPWDDPKTWASVRDFGASGVQTGNFNGNIRTFGGGDGYYLDQADWANARVELADGHSAFLTGVQDGYAPAPTDLLWTRFSNGKNDYNGQELPPRINRSNGQNGPIVLLGKTYERGLGVHAPSEIVYQLNGKYAKFKADVGVDAQVSNDGYGSVEFEVWSDGKRVFRSGVRFSNQMALPVSVDVRGVRELKLVVTQGEDDTRAIQAAVDSGATTVYFPPGTYSIGKPVLLRGRVRRVEGCEASVGGAGSFQTAPVFKAAPLLFERFTGLPRVSHMAARTLILSDCQMTTYDGGGRGTLFLEDVVGGPFAFGAQTMWARQLNVENEGTHISNFGGQLWILGLKTERGGTLIDTRDGTTELLGGLCYTTTAGKLAPMFTLHNAQASLSFGEVCYNGDPYTQIILDTRGAQTKSFARGEVPFRIAFMNGSALPLYVSRATGAATAGK